MRRISDVFDVWFDSGSMPYAQVHYPFENAEWFEHHYPGDFIVDVVVGEVVLRREVVGLGLALLSDAGGELVGLVQVVRNRTEVVEELAEQVPAAVLAHDVGAEEEIAVAFDGVL